MSEKETGQTFAEWAEDGRMMGGMERMFAEDAWKAAAKQQAGIIERLQAELAEVTKERDEAQGRCIEGSAELNALTLQVEQLREALGGMLTHMGMDEDEWNQPTYSKAREALTLSAKPAEEIIAANAAKVIEPYAKDAEMYRLLRNYGFDLPADVLRGVEEGGEAMDEAIRALIAALKPGESKEVG